MNNSFLNTYDIILKEKYKILFFTISVILIFFFFFYNFYSKSKFVTNILIDNSPNLYFINKFDTVYTNLYSYKDNNLSNQYSSLFQEFYNQIINNKTILISSLDSLSKQFNMKNNSKNYLNSIELNKKNFDLMGDKRTFHGKQYLEIKYDKKIYHDYRLYNKEAIDFFINSLVYNSNQYIFDEFNNVTKEKIDKIDLKSIENNIINLKNQFNQTLALTINDLKNEISNKVNLIKNDWENIINKTNLNNEYEINILLNEIFLSENTFNSTNDEFVEYLIKLKNIEDFLIKYNIFYAKLLLDELEKQDFYNLSSSIDETIFYSYNSNQNMIDYYRENLYFPNYTIYKQIKLSKLTEINNLITKALNNKKEFEFNLTNFSCDSNCYFGHIISSKNQEYIFKDLSNFYILLVLGLSIFILIIYLIITLIVMNYKIRKTT